MTVCKSLLLCFTVINIALAIDWPTRVNIDNGSIQGFEVDGTNYFLGIPYAHPPVGDLRWAPPVPYSIDRAIDATKFSNVCIQPINAGVIVSYTFPPNVTTSEDCLTMNIWAPSKSDGLNPVMVWIHGGGLSQGGNVEYRERGQNMSKLGNVVVVFLNYRLGALGFMAHPLFSTPDHPTTGNYGFLDQRLVLQWVNSSISKFGGDPKKVTIFGESAGGSSVGFHLVSEASHGLFQRAIMESGATFAETISLQTATQQAILFQQDVGCTGSGDDILRCLRSLTVSEILQQSFTPTATVENFELKSHPYHTVIYNSDKIAHVPFISGNVKNEGSLFVQGYPSPMSNDQYNSAVTDLFKEFAPQVLAFYPCANYNASDCRVALAEIVGDYELVCPGVLYANALAQNVTLPVYTYVFNHVPYYNQRFGAYHSSEIEFVFSTLSSFRPYQPPEEILANKMTRYWTSFGTAADPNYGNSGLVKWPPFGSPDYARINLDIDIEISVGYAQKQCQFWKQFFDIIYNY